VGPHLAAQPAQVQGGIDPAQQMIRRHHIFEIELIEKTVLPTYRLTHHRPDLLAQPSQARNHISPRFSTDFFNSLSHKETFVGTLDAPNHDIG
jgi:hypothetical protein